VESVSVQPMNIVTVGLPARRSPRTRETAVTTLPETQPTPLTSVLEAAAWHQDPRRLQEMRDKTSPETESAKEELVHQYHLQGHFGREAIYRKLFANGHWWPRMRKTIVTELQGCDECIRFVVPKAGFHPAKSITALLPGDHWMIDCSTHMLPSAEGYTAILHVIDVFTGFTMLRPLKTTSAEEVAAALLELCALLGWPLILQSDNGPEFSNKVIRALCALLHIDNRLIQPYNPRADGKIERNVGTTVMIVKKMVHGTAKSWPLFLPFAQMYVNDKIATLTNSSPFALMFGRRMNSGLDEAKTPLEEVDLKVWRAHMEKVIAIVYPAISDRVRCMKADMRATLDKHRRMLVEDSIPPGAVVMLRDQDRTSKRDPAYVGPYYVIRRARNGGYVLRDATGDILDRHVPVDQLKLVSKQPRSSDTEDNIYVVRKIVDHRGQEGEWEFLVDWQGYKEKTWEAESQFQDYDVIKKYWETTASSASSAAPKRRQRR
jgi:transposase InsO family protein